MSWLTLNPVIITVQCISGGQFVLTNRRSLACFVIFTASSYNLDNASRYHTWVWILFVPVLIIIDPLLKLGVIKESNCNLIPIEYSSFKCINRLNDICQNNLVGSRKHIKLTRRADSWLVNLTKTGTGGPESRET